MQRNIKLILSWNGAGFSGYQIQPHATTVQGVLTQALQLILRHEVTLIGCSRLDAQVHAYRYVLCFHTTSDKSCLEIAKSLNGILHTQFHAAVAVLGCEDAPLDFHARFYTVGKHYRYLIWYGLYRHALLGPRAWNVRSSKEPAYLQEIFAPFVGEYDFRSLRASDCGAKTTRRRVHKIDVWSHPHFPQMSIVDVWGEGFLKNMIRNMVGLAVHVAIEKEPASRIAASLTGEAPHYEGMCAPAWGLTLMNVYYEAALFHEEGHIGARHLIPC